MAFEPTALQLASLEGLDEAKKAWLMRLWEGAYNYRMRKEADRNAEHVEGTAQPDGDGGAQPGGGEARRGSPKRRPGVRRRRQGAQRQEPAAARQEEGVIVGGAPSWNSSKEPGRILLPLCPVHATSMRETHLWKGGWACDECIAEYRAKPVQMDRQTQRAFFMSAAEGMGSVFTASPEILTSGQPLTFTTVTTFTRFMAAYKAWRESLG